MFESVVLPANDSSSGNGDPLAVLHPETRYVQQRTQLPTSSSSWWFGFKITGRQIYPAIAGVCLRTAAQVLYL